jgi:UDP-glucose 4-epimerase
LFATEYVSESPSESDAVGLIFSTRPINTSKEFATEIVGARFPSGGGGLLELLDPPSMLHAIRRVAAAPIKLARNVDWITLMSPPLNGADHRPRISIQNTKDVARWRQISRLGITHQSRSDSHVALKIVAIMLICNRGGSMGAILVTGGAGYIGSHVVRQLGEQGDQLHILDNLSTGFRSAVLHGEFIEGDTTNARLVSELLKSRKIESVLHFAAHIVVSESVANPLKYYRNNTGGTQTLLQCCVEAGVKNFIFSSTAAVYGIPPDGTASEETPTAPINPYGCSKLMSELMLRDTAAAHPIRYVALRYFNVAGADPGGRIGQSTPEATHLIKVACQHVVGRRDQVSIFGTDYDTPDGTCVRDYIHVEDLAAAHLQALDYLRAGGTSTTLNCGYGHGFSVREVLDEVARVSSKKLQVTESPRRAGDPPCLVAKADRIREVLSWVPRHRDLAGIVSSALAWEKRLLRQPMT